MSNLTKTNWLLGWQPGADAVNGDPQGLLRMDNLRLDKTGAVSLVDGHQIVTASFSDFVSALYSKMVNGRETLWAATGSPASAVTRSFGFFGGTSLVVAGAGSPNANACFADAFGYTLACAGNLRAKDPVSSSPLPLGLLTPNPPSVTINVQQNIVIAGPDKVVEGTGGPGPLLTVDSTTFEGTLVTSQSIAVDTTVIGSTQSSDIGLDIIQFPFTVQDKPASVVTSVELDFLLDGTSTDPSTWKNYYALTFTNDSLASVAGNAGLRKHGGRIQSGKNTQSLLSQNRWQADRFGNDQTLNWSKVIGIRFLVIATTTCTVQFGDITLLGGAQGGLNGSYNYIQVDVANDGRYLAKSPASAQATAGPGSFNFNVINGSVTLVPGSGSSAQVNEHWFFRKSATNLGVDPITGFSNNPSSLNQYNFVGKVTAGAFVDSLSDTDILQLNADGSLLPNLFLRSLAAADLTNGLQDSIYGMEGLYNERMLYMGASFVYLSDRLNPDAVDARYTLRPSGDPGEKNLWLKKLTNNVLMLATTKNLYEISGTLLDLPDGSVDVNLIPLGEAYPPLSVDVCNYNGGLYYVGADGLRVTTGSNSINVTPHLRHLFQNVILGNQAGLVARHGVPGVGIAIGSGDYSVAAAHGKIYFAVPLQDGSRRVFVFDTVTSTGYLLFTDPLKLFTSQAGELLAAYGSGASNAIYALEAVPGYGANGKGIPFRLRTVFDSNQQPRNRKDTFTLKLVMDTGGQPVSVDIQKDGAGVTELDEPQWINLGQYSASGQQTIYISLGQAAGVSLGFRYALQISDVSGVTTFKLYEFSIEYEPRPEQLNYLRLQPTNFGTISRKRLTAFAFVVDTLGNNVNFIPFLDNVLWSRTDVINTVLKTTYIFYFQSEALATDVGGIFTGGPFEFYGVALEECVSEKLPTPTTFLVIPPNNYGTPQRKRHTSYKFQLLSRGGNVTFTPQLDGVLYASTIFNTTRKQTVEYYFPASAGDVVGVDIGGTLSAAGPFEFYGPVQPQKVEVLPDRLEYLRLPNSNFGSAAKKRLRTLPLVLDTLGNDVTYTPVVDGVSLASTKFNTKGKLTVFHYFVSDVFGVDFGGVLSGAAPFEFYEMPEPADVEVLPVPKLFDQIGPMRFDKVGKLFGFRLRLIMNGSTVSLPWSLYDDSSISYNNPLVSGTLITLPGQDFVYEVQLQKNINVTLARLVLGPSTDSFHRYDAQMKVQLSGMQGQSRWQTIR